MSSRLMFLFALIIVFNIVSFAPAFCLATDSEASCPTVDLSAKTGRIESQGDTVWCYAFADATLATFATGKEVSAADIAINYNAQLKDPQSDIHKNVAYIFRGKNQACFESIVANSVDNIESGYPDLAFNGTLKAGFCKLEDLPDEVRTKEGSYWSGKERILEMEHALATINPHVNCIETQFLHAAFPTSDLRKLAKAIKEANEFETVKAANQFVCRSRVRSPYLAQTIAFAQNDPRNTINLQAELAAGRPAVVSLNAMELMSAAKQSAARQHNENNRGGTCFHEEALNVAAHAISIVGQRFNKDRQRCEAMVKNSWGKDPRCTRYDTSEMTCDSRGYVYVPYDLIQKNIFSMTVLRPAKN